MCRRHWANTPFYLSHYVKELIKRKHPDISRKNYPDVSNLICIPYTTVHGRLTYTYSKSSSSRRSASSKAAICNLFTFIVVVIYIVLLFIRLVIYFEQKESKSNLLPCYIIYTFYLSKSLIRISEFSKICCKITNKNKKTMKLFRFLRIFKNE